MFVIRSNSKPNYPVKSNGIRTTKRRKLKRRWLSLLIGGFLFFPPSISTAIPESYSLSPAIIQIPQVVQAQFPDMADNYQKTIVIPTQEAAQRAAEAQAALLAQQQAQAILAPSARPSGSCNDWMVGAGISDMGDAYNVIMAESGCNPNAVNSSSGACGIGQQLPCGKWSHVWNDPVGGLIDMQGYVYGRYGSWAAAWQYELAHHSY